MNRRHTQRWLLICLGAPLWMACGGDSPSPQRVAPASELSETPAAETSAVLFPLPKPPLDRLEPQARELIQGLQADLQGTASAVDDIAAPEALWGELGQTYLAYDFTAAAAQCLANAEQLDPGNPRWPYYRAVVAQRRGDLAAAEAHLERTLELRPGDVPTVLRLARMALEAHDLEAAEQRFQEALADPAAAAYASYGLGRVAIERQDPQRAIVHFRQTLAQQPEATAVHHALGLAHRDAGSLDKATQHLALAGPQAPRFDDPWLAEASQKVTGARVHLSQGGRDRRAGRYDSAIQHFRRAIELAPEDPSGHHNLGVVLGDLGRHREAVGHLQLALELEPERIDALFDLAMAHSRLGQMDEAVANLDRVLTLDPLDHEARRRRAALHLQQGRTEMARTELRQMLTADTQDTASRWLLAQAEEAAGNPEAAGRHYEAVAVAEPDRLAAHLGVVRLWMASGDYGRVKGHLETALENPSSSPETRYPLQHLLARLLATCPDATLRNGPRALELAQQVFARQPTLPHGETLGLALAEAGRFEEATALQEQLVEQARRAGAPPALRQRLEMELASYRRGEAVRADH